MPRIPNPIVQTAPSIPSVLNEFMGRFIDEELANINMNVIKQDLHPGNTYEVTEIHEDLNWQRMPNGDGAFMLDAPTAGNILTVLKPREAYVKRVLLGYSVCSRIASSGNYDSFKRFIKPIIIQLLMGLIKLKGFGPEMASTGTSYLTFKRPGPTSADYFRDMENQAAFELRAYSDCLRTNIYIPTDVPTYEGPQIERVV